MIYNTFGIPATADRFIELHTLDDLRQLLDSKILQQHPFFVIGGGSNVVFTRHFPGTVIHPANRGIALVDGPSADGSLLVEAAAGEEWDAFVRQCIAQGWHGAENLVAIPGTVGASPVQNVGAYGLEAKDIIHTVRAFNIFTGEERIFTNGECRFGYRSSIFKTDLKDQYIVWSVTFRLHKSFQPCLQYQALTSALQRQGIENPTPQQLADTIASVRWSKLPRPEETGSAGSFFKNPVVSRQQYGQLIASYPDMVAYPVPEGYKLAAGWLIEHAGWKGRNMGRCGVYDKQALVLVNRGGCSGAEVLALADAVTSDVQRLFGVTLEKEAIII